MNARRFRIVSTALTVAAISVLWCAAAICEQPAADTESSQKPMSPATAFSRLGTMTRPNKVDFRFDQGERTMGEDGPVYKVNGHVWLSDGVSELRADEATFYETRQIVEAHGNVVLTQQDGVVKADYVVYDFLNQSGVMENVRGEMTPFKFTAPKIEQTGPGEAVIENPTVTTCDPDDMFTYKITAPRAEYHDGTLMQLRGALVYLGPIPIFYWPRIGYRRNATRPRLEVNAGSESDIGQFVRLGMNFSPLPNTDMTLRTDGYTKAGYGFGLDGNFDIFKPDLDPDKHPELLRGHGHGEFITYLAKDERSRVQAYYRHEFPADWVALMQVEHWSDPKFLKEFYYKEFKKRTEPESLVNLTKTWQDATFSATIRKQVTGFQEDVNRLPQAQVEVADIPLFDNALTFSLNESLGYLRHRPDGPESARDYGSARLALTAFARPGMAVVPYIEGSRTWYSRTPGRDGADTNANYRAGAAAAVRAHKVYPSFLNAYKELKHVIIPTVAVSYSGAPRLNQADHFSFDAMDESFRYGRVDLQLDNRVIGRDDTGNQRQLLRWTLYNGTDFTSGQRTTRDWESWIALYPLDWMAITSVAETHRGMFDSSMADISLQFGHDTSDTERLFRIGFSYEDNDIETINRDISTRFTTRLGSKYKVSVEYRYDFEDQELDLQEYELERDLGCFIGQIGIRDRRQSTDIYIMLSLTAFPKEKIRF